MVADCLSRIPCIKPSDVTASISSLLSSSKVEEPISLAELHERAALIQESSLAQHPALATLCILASPLLAKETWIAAQEADSGCSELRSELLSNPSSPHLREFSLQNKLLAHTSECSGSVLLVPKAMVQKVIASQ